MHGNGRDAFGLLLKAEESIPSTGIPSKSCFDTHLFSRSHNLRRVLAIKEGVGDVFRSRHIAY